jgi:hypothetical protein
LTLPLSAEFARTTTHTRGVPNHEETQFAPEHKSDSVMAGISQPAQERF